MHYKNQKFGIYIGNRHDAIYSSWYLQGVDRTTLYNTAPFYQRMFEMKIQDLFFLKQVHGNKGVVLDTQNYGELQSFYDIGDYLITHISLLGVGVMVADCLPIIIYDKNNHVIGVVHAGWRGTWQSILVHALNTMHHIYHTRLSEVQIFFGPCAQVCCYQVDDQLVSKFCSLSYAQRLFITRNRRTYFNLVMANRLQAYYAGVPDYAITDLARGMCTICDNSFFSYRRQSQQSGRQMIIAYLV